MCSEPRANHVHQHRSERYHMVGHIAASYSVRCLSTSVKVPWSDHSLLEPSTQSPPPPRKLLVLYQGA